MSPVSSKTLSMMATLGFMLWIIWMWMDDQGKVVQKEQVPQKNEEVIEQEQEKPVKAQAPQVLALPSPPQKQIPVPVQKGEALPVKELEPEPLPQKEAEVVEAQPEPVPTPTPAPASEPIPTVERTPAPSKVAEPINQEIKTARTEKVAPKVEKQSEPVVQVSQVDTQKGRALLRVLEHGKGPLIEIAWPQSAAMREELYKRFQSCFGMESAVMDQKGDLYRLDENRGMRWEINLDRYSGFLRQASGRLPRGEEAEVSRIMRKHGKSGGTTVRIFPRRVDASLLGSLQAMMGQQYSASKSIQARYLLEGGHVLVGDIRFDGQALEGRIELAPYKTCSGRA